MFVWWKYKLIGRKACMTSFAGIFPSLAGDWQNVSLWTVAILSYVSLDKNQKIKNIISSKRELHSLLLTVKCNLKVAVVVNMEIWFRIF